MTETGGPIAPADELPAPPVAAVIAVEPGQQGNLGAIMRVAANFGVPALELVRPWVSPTDDETLRWACGGEALLEVNCYGTLEEAAAPYRTLVGTSSGRGRGRHPLVGPAEALAAVSARGRATAALVVGNETRGLAREDLDRCDLVVRLPTRPEFPVLNVAQATAILLGLLADAPNPALEPAPELATSDDLESLMDHLRSSLLAIGFLEPANPERILRKVRRLLARSAPTANEVAILRGICRQVDWAAGFLPPAADTVESVAPDPAPGPVGGADG